MDNKKSLFSELYAMFFMLLPAILLAECGITWLLGGRITPFAFPVGFILAYISALRLAKQPLNSKGIVPIVCVIFVLVLLCYFLHDSSCDGFLYHQQGVAALSEGWNPIYNHHCGIDEDVAYRWEKLSTKTHVGPMDVSGIVWVDHYAKGQETLCATVMSTFGNIEIGKIANFFLPLSSFFFSLMALNRHFPIWTNRKKMFLAFIIAFPPIIWNQVFTFYIDFVLYPLIVIAFCSVILYECDKLRFCVILASLVIIAFSVKLNMFMWLGMLYCGILVYLFFKRHYKMVRLSFIVGVTAVIVALFTSVYNPYITNTIDHRSPFYPLMGGEVNIDIMSHIEPDAFKGLSVVEKIVAADLSRPTTGNDCKELQCPYGGYKLSNVKACGAVDPRVGGTGLFWIDCLLLSIILFIASKSYKKKYSQLYLLIAALFFATQFIVPGGWWYRYVSYIYLIPLLFLFASENEVKKKWQMYMRRTIYVLLFLNSIVGLVASVGVAFISNQIEDYYVNCINASTKPCWKSDYYGFVRKISPEKKSLYIENGEMLPIVAFRVGTKVQYENLNRNVETTFIQDLLLKKGIIK